MVWSVKYRKKVLIREVEEALKRIPEETAPEKGFTLHLAEVGNAEHVHCFV